MSKTDYRLEIETVRGEMLRDKKMMIEILSFEYASDSPRDVATGQALGRRRHSGVTFTKLLDYSSPAIQMLLVQNAALKTVKLTCTKAGGIENPFVYYECIWSDAYVYHYKVRGELLEGEEEPAIPRDEFSITFGKVDVTYTRQSKAGANDGKMMFHDEPNRG